MRVIAFMAGWEIECCQPPPGVGDQVSWRLHWVAASVGAGVQELAWVAQPAESARGRAAQHSRFGQVLQSGPLTAWWDEQTAPRAAPPSRGYLYVDAHAGAPEAMAALQGRVAAVDVVEQVYRRTAPREYQPVPEDFTLRRVERSPKCFRWGRVPDAGTVGDGPEVDRHESGVLVHLDIDADTP